MGIGILKDVFKLIMNFSDSLPYILLPMICVAFDEALKISIIRKNNVLRSITDNTAHGTVALVSWCAVVGVDAIDNKKDVIETILCTVIACAIDLDHFISAKSFRLKVSLL